MASLSSSYKQIDSRGVIRSTYYLILPLATYIDLYFNRPQRSCGKVMLSQASVILFTGMGRGGRHPPGRHPLGKHPLPSACWNTHPLPNACWDTHPSCPVHAGIYTPCPMHAVIHSLTATAAEGTYPNGMHSCLTIQVVKGLYRGA